MSISRRNLLFGISASTALACLGACSSGTAAKTHKKNSTNALVIGMSYTPNIQFAPFYLALADGKYASSVSLRHHGAQEGLFDALLAGNEQLVVAGADEAVAAAASGADLVIVGGYYQQYPGCVIVPEASKILTLSDLKGKRIGLPGRYGENWFALQVALQTAGLTESDLSIQEIGYTQQAALVGGKVDAIVGFKNNDAVQIAQAGTPVRSLDIAQTVPLVGASLITSATALAQQRSQLAAAVTASAAGMSAFITDPNAAVEATKTYVSDLVDPTQAANAREVGVATAALITPADEHTQIGAINIKDVETTITFLSEHGLITKAPTASDICVPLLSA